MSASLPQRHTPRSVRLRVAQDTNRAERIRQLKADHPGWTWAYIADYVGVKERSAVEWQRTGGLNSANAEKLAELFGVSYDYLWFGKERGPTPDLLAGVAHEDTVEDVREEFRGKVDAILDRLQHAETERSEFKALIDQQNRLLADQSKLLDQQRGLLAEMREESSRMQGALSLLPAVQRLLQIQAGAAEPRPAERPALGVGEERRAGEDRRRHTG